MLFFSVISTIFPIFILIALGYITMYLGLFKKEVSDALMSLSTKLLLPLLLFQTLSVANLTLNNPLPLWVGYYSSVLIVFSLGTLIALFVMRKNAPEAIVGGVASAYGNTGFMGIPLITSLFGRDGLIPMALISAIQLPLIMITSVALMSIIGNGTSKTSFRTMLTDTSSKLLTNPIIIATVLGALWSLAGFKMPNFLSNTLDLLADAATPIALLSVGMIMVNYGIRGTLVGATVFSLLKLLLMPFTVYFFTAHVFDMSSLWVSVATIAAALPTGVNSIMFANMFNANKATTTNTITLTSITIVFSIFFWLCFLKVKGF
ncbi:AEC family transporter [uncultured Shewanella sp.]|uniref:AEC family transporter n=1 Tax=uncultured Shewanella sp. TaxID=173975 RepID=UPI00262654D4|nr:AEC family transporter [uncultured Shewanella sp.]